MILIYPYLSGVRTTGSAGSADPHFLEHGVQRGQGHRISDNWIGGSYSILAEIALENIIFGRHCRNIE